MLNIISYLTEIGLFKGIIWIINTLSYEVLFSFLDIYGINVLFTGELPFKKILKITGMYVASRIAFIVLIGNFEYRLLNFILVIVFIRYFFNQRWSVAVFAEIANAILVLLVETIASKILFTSFDFISSYSIGRYDFEFNICFTLIMIIGRTAVIYLLAKFNITYSFRDDLSGKDVLSIIIVSAIGGFVIVGDVYTLLFYIQSLPSIALLINLIALDVYFYISTTNILRMNKGKEDYGKILKLENYSHTLSILYDNLRGFRHDYANFLMALSGYIENEDTEGINQLIESAMIEYGQINNMSGLVDPKMINNPGIYSVLTNKYFSAKEKGLIIDISVTEPFDDKCIDYDFCKMFGILLDNAIEAALDCEEKIVKVKFEIDRKHRRKLLIIANSYCQKDINIDKIFEKGYSTKTDRLNEHGLGLWHVRKILSKSSKLNLYTTKQDLFSQQIEIYN